MPFSVTATSLPEVLVLEPQVFGDDRGFFFESFNTREFQRATGLTREFIQDNHSRSSRGVLRGLHYQVVRPQGKLVRVVSGEVFDVAVDMRAGSPTIGHWTSATLSAQNRRQLWIPEGFAHGFLVLSESAEVLYKTTDYWYPEHDRSLLWSDPEIGIDWPLEEPPRLAAKDATAKRFGEAQLCDAVASGT